MPYRSTEDYRRALWKLFPDNGKKNNVLREAALFLLLQPGQTAELGLVGQHLHQHNLSTRDLRLGPLQKVLDKSNAFKVGPPCRRPTTLLVNQLPEYLFDCKQPSAAGQQQQQQQCAAHTHEREAEVDDSAQLGNEAKRQRLVCPSLMLVESQAALPTAAAADRTVRGGLAPSAALTAAGAADQQAAASAIAHVQQQLTVSASSRDVERMRLMSSMFEFGTAMVKAGAAPDKVMQLLDEARGLITSSGSSGINGDSNSNGVSNGYRITQRQ